MLKLRLILTYLMVVSRIANGKNGNSCNSDEVDTFEPILDMIAIVDSVIDTQVLSATTTNN